MSDFDDTQYWDGRPWEDSGAIPTDPPARTTGTHRIHRTGRHQVERTRSHHIVISTREPDDAYDDLYGDWTPVDHWVETEEPLPIRQRLAGLDPRLVRIGAVAAAGLLLIPIALALRSDPADGVRSDAGTTTTVAITAPPQVLAASPTTITVPAAPVTAAPAPVAAAPVAAAPVAQAAPVTAAKPVCAGKYTVVFNDYWNRFPKSSGATVAQWLAANNATANTPLYVGDELCIPAGAKAPAPPPPTTTAPPATTAAPAATAAPVTAAPPRRRPRRRRRPSLPPRRNRRRPPPRPW